MSSRQRGTPAPLAPQLGLFSDLIVRLISADYQLPRPGLDQAIFESIPAIVNLIRGLAAPLVYTAFDGDHLGLTPQMRAYVLGRGAVPVNPESVLGYKQLVDARRDKSRLMLDDLALLNRCNELWVFTDVKPSPREVARSLAEGVIIELLYFLSHRSTDRAADVYFVPIRTLLSGRGGRRRKYKYSYAQTARALKSDQTGVTDFVNAVNDGTHPIPKIVLIGSDPLDTKYAHWLRSNVYGSGMTPLVPQIAVELNDGELLSTPVGEERVLLSWLRFADVADEFKLMPPIDYSRRESYFVGLLAHWWQSHDAHRNSDRPVEKSDWRDLAIPKLISAPDWSITDREANAT